MGFHVRTNTESSLAQYYLEKSRERLDRSQVHLASGQRINYAAEDPTGLSISEHYRLLQRAKIQNSKNAEDAVGYLETADGALSTITNTLIRMRELSMRAASDVFGQTERGYLDYEYQQLKQELERIAQSTTLGQKHLLNGEGGNVTAQVGPFNGAFDQIDVSASHDLTLDRLGISSFDVLSVREARDSLEVLDTALSDVAAARGEIGASETRLYSVISNCEDYHVNVSAALSRVLDTDYALESTEAAKMKIQTQSGVAILAQANNVPQLALKLIS